MQRRLGSSSLMAIGIRKKSKCKMCKQVFWHTAEHVYRGCCSYGCMRKMDKENEAKREEKRGTKTVISTECAALRRIAKCEERLAFYEKLAEDKTLDQKAHETAKKGAWEWRKKLEDAHVILDMLRGEDDEQAKECVS